MHPYTVLVHLKDGYMENGEVRFQLAVKGRLNLTPYIPSLNRVGLDLPVFAEVSMQISNRSDYYPWATVQICIAALDYAGNNTYMYKNDLGLSGGGVI